MSAETDRQLKRILIVLGIGFVALVSLLAPSINQAYKFMQSGEGAQMFKDMTNVRNSLITKFGHEQVGVTSLKNSELYAVFINSRFATLPEKLRDDKADKIRKAMIDAYSQPDSLNEIRIVFVKYNRRLFKMSEKDIRASYRYLKNDNDEWILQIQSKEKVENEQKEN